MSYIDGLLDGQGYVRTTHTGGDDATVVNAARVSFDRAIAGPLEDKDIRLLHYLASHGHTSPFRHVTLGLEIKAPLMVARQWWKHVVGAPFVDTPWNESSRRYVTEEPEVYLPNVLLGQAADKKQGSGDPVPEQRRLLGMLADHQEAGIDLYNHLLKHGVAVEQARLALPAYGLYVKWRWVPTLQAAHHFVALRDHADAQSEIVPYARAVSTLASMQFPHSWQALTEAGSAS